MPRHDGYHDGSQPTFWWRNEANKSRILPLPLFIWNNVGSHWLYHVVKGTRYLPYHRFSCEYSFKGLWQIYWCNYTDENEAEEGSYSLVRVFPCTSLWTKHIIIFIGKDFIVKYRLLDALYSPRTKIYKHMIVIVTITDIRRIKETGYPFWDRTPPFSILLFILRDINSRSKFFALSVDPILEGYVDHGNKHEVTKVASLWKNFRKNVFTHTLILCPVNQRVKC